MLPELDGYQRVLVGLGIPLTGGTEAEVTKRMQLAHLHSAVTENPGQTLEDLQRRVAKEMEQVMSWTGMSAEQLHQILGS